MGNSLDKILPGLYVGGIRAASKEQILKDNQITHILSIHERATPLHQGRQYLCINANDNAGQNLSQYFTQCSDFIHQARLNGGNVLVHCFAGISRSVTVTVAYIVTVTDLPWKDVLKAVRGARNCANPNFGFQRQLLAFYHDDLYEEKKRFFTKFPKRLEHDDEGECRRLIKVHQDWVIYGDEAPPLKVENDDDDQDTYPLQHNAYSITNDNSEEDSKLENLTDKTKTQLENITFVPEPKLEKLTVVSEQELENLFFVPEPELENRIDKPELDQTQDDDNDDNDNEEYIDMTKNSFHKTMTRKSAENCQETGNKAMQSLSVKKVSTGVESTGVMNGEEVCQNSANLETGNI